MGGETGGVLFVYVGCWPEGGWDRIGQPRPSNIELTQNISTLLKYIYVKINSVGRLYPRNGDGYTNNRQMDPRRDPLAEHIGNPRRLLVESGGFDGCYPLLVTILSSMLYVDIWFPYRS